MADTISNEDYVEQQLAALIENPITPPDPLELTKEEFQKYIDSGVDPRILHATMYDATLMLGRVFYAAQRQAKKDKKAECSFRHFLLDCSARLLPIFEAYAPGNYCMRKCLEVGHLFADEAVGELEAKAAIKELAQSLTLEDMPVEPFWALASAMMAVGWNWLDGNCEEGQEMLDNGAFVIRAAYTISVDVQAERNWHLSRLTEAMLDTSDADKRVVDIAH
ncbi:MAG: hypothetical protein AAF437_04095 [Pseudomonadota bacterium]